MRDPLTIPPTSPTQRAQDQAPLTVFYSQHVTNRTFPNSLKTQHFQIPTRNTFPLFANALRPAPPSTARVQIDGHAVPSIFTVSLIPPTKPPKLMGTDFSCARRCNVRNIACRPPRSLDTPPSHTLQISRHLCRDIFGVSLAPSTKLQKYRGTFSHPWCTTNHHSRRFRAAPGTLRGRRGRLMGQRGSHKMRGETGARSGARPGSGANGRKE